MRIDLTQIILAIITLIGGLVARYVIPWIRSKLDERQYDIFHGLVRVGVFAAEQLFESNEGVAKKAYVINLLKDNGYDINVPAVDAEIEATVKELRIEMK